MTRDAKNALAAAAIFGLLTAIVFLMLPGILPPAGKSDPVRIGMPALEQGALIYLAWDREIFEKNGLSVTIRDDYPDGAGPVRDMAEGEVDLSVSAEYPVVARILSGVNVSIIATIDRCQNEKLIVRRDSGIGSISDLRGRRIGVPGGTILEFFLGRLLERNGLNITDVTIVHTPGPDQAGAIASGDVDAVISYEPYAGRILDRLGGNAISWPGQSDQLLYGVVAGRSDWIEGHPDQVCRFLRSLEEAQQYALTNPGDLKAAVGRHMNMTNGYLDSVWPEHQFGLSLDQSLLVAMNAEGRWMIANSLVTASAVPDFRMNISTPGLTSAAPASVNIV